jgi:ubiquinone/menaquinone biosynthesis C-methylase UbiE
MIMAVTAVVKNVYISGAPVRFTNYDAIAATYDRRYLDHVENDYSGIETALTAFVCNGSRVLEVGCGTGHWLQRPGMGTAVGVDLSWEMLAQARTKGTRYLSQARAEELPFASASFDRLFCINAHHHFADKMGFFREAYRVLGRGGSLMTIALDPHNGADRWWIYEYFEGTLENDKERYPSCDQLRDGLRRIGFINVHTRMVQHLPGDITARQALNDGLITRSRTSQLAILSDAELDAGMKRIRDALKENSSLRLQSNLRVYATYGTHGVGA